MKTPRWYIWFTLVYAVYNLLIIALMILVPSFSDKTNGSVLSFNILLVCISFSVLLFNGIMFVYFIVKKTGKPSLWLSGLQVFDFLFTLFMGLIVEILFAKNLYVQNIGTNIVGAIIPLVLLVYTSYLLLKEK
jgi:hypothetical protein